MIKMAAETKTSPQQSEVGMLSITGCGADAGGGSDIGGRPGRLIRVVSSSCGVTTSPRRGGRVIRTVSFLGSLGSAIVTLTGGTLRLPEIGYVVTGELTVSR